MVYKLLKLKASPPCRAVSIIAKALNVEIDEHEIDYRNGEHLQPEFLKLNPLHTVPILDDDGLILCDSHAIAVYLIFKHAKDDSLYPKDPRQRALVDQKNAFDLGIIFPMLRTVDTAYMNHEIKELTEKMIKDIKNVYNYLETFLKNSEWIAIDRLTIADVHCVTTVTCLNYHVKIEPEDYPNTFNWMKRCLEMPYFGNDSERLQLFENFFDELKNK
ncbi:hypothetical protein FQA39_LY05412 [Lamprigera yunnana]|nr:hypothetical protein FQA39_LY05412 [Lamprigera yunnana]